MKLSGQATLALPVDAVWEAMLDPAVLVRTIPGCERLEATGENAYAMTVTAGLAAIRGTYSGTCALADLDPLRSLRLVAQGAGAPGTIQADVDVRFADNGDGTTTLSYDADTVVGGMIGGVGQRMLSSVSRRLAAEFFGNVEGAVRADPAGGAAGDPAGGAAGGPAGSSGPAGVAPGVFEAPRPLVSASAPRDFLTGIAVGAALVSFGVGLGVLAGRRR